jgi:predicted permease
MSSPPRWAIGLYRAVLRLYPSRARERFGDDEIALFAEVWRDEQPATWLGAVGWRVRMFWRALANAIAYRREPSRAEVRRSAASSWRAARPLASDVRSAARSVRLAPWQTLTTLAVIAGGLAVTATVFALVDGILFEPLPYRDAHELYAVRGVHRGASGESIDRTVSPLELAAWRAAAPDVAFSAQSTPIGYGPIGVVNGPGVWSRGVDRDFWTVIGVAPIVGGLRAADYVTEPTSRLAIITFGLWQRVLGGTPDVVGRRLDAGRVSFQVAGVLPREFVFPTDQGRLSPEILEPHVPSGTTGRYLTVIARVPSALSVDAVQARLAAALRSVQAEPGAGPRRPFDAVVLTPLRAMIVANERTGALLAAAAAGVMTLLVAINVGGLTASRARARAREFAARRALGASTGDLARLLFVEAGSVTLAGAIVGATSARWLLDGTTSLLPPGTLLVRPPAIDARVVAVVVAAAFAVATVSTLLSLRAARTPSLTSVLGQGAGAPSRRNRSRLGFLVEAGQVALAIALVITGALFVASTERSWAAERGYGLDDALFLDVRFAPAPGSGIGNTPARTLALLDAIRGVPGVGQACAIDTLFLAGARRGSVLRPRDGNTESQAGELIPVSSGFFQLAQLRALEGRLPSDAEIEAGAPLAVVSARTAREYWPGRSAVGQALSSSRATVTVVGVVADARVRGLDVPSDGEIYVPLALELWSTTAAHYLIRPSAPDARLLPALIEAVRRFDPAAGLQRAQSVVDALGESIKRRRFQAWVFGVLAISGLAIAGIGIFGLTAGATARRTREMGVRLALGSTPGRLVHLMLREQLAPIAAGTAAGVLLARWSSRFVAALLYEVDPYDVRVWLGAVVIVLAVAVAGILLPAVRTSRVDPVRALRVE